MIPVQDVNCEWTRLCLSEANLPTSGRSPVSSEARRIKYAWSVKIPSPRIIDAISSYVKNSSRYFSACILSFVNSFSKWQASANTGDRETGVGRPGSSPHKSTGCRMCGRNTELGAILLVSLSPTSVSKIFVFAFATHSSVCCQAHTRLSRKAKGQALAALADKDEVSHSQIWTVSYLHKQWKEDWSEVPAPWVFASPQKGWHQNKMGLMGRF